MKLMKKKNEESIIYLLNKNVIKFIWLNFKKDK